MLLIIMNALKKKFSDLCKYIPLISKIKQIIYDYLYFLKSLNQHVYKSSLFPHANIDIGGTYGNRVTIILVIL